MSCIAPAIATPIRSGRRPPDDDAAARQPRFAADRHEPDYLAARNGSCAGCTTCSATPSRQRGFSTKTGRTWLIDSGVSGSSIIRCWPPRLPWKNLARTYPFSYDAEAKSPIWAAPAERYYPDHGHKIRPMGRAALCGSERRSWMTMADPGGDDRGHQGGSSTITRATRWGTPGPAGDAGKRRRNLPRLCAVLDESGAQSGFRH